MMPFYDFVGRGRSWETSLTISPFKQSTVPLMVFSPLCWEILSYWAVSDLSVVLNTYPSYQQVLFHNIFCSLHSSSLWPPLDTYSRVPQRTFSLCLSSREKQGRVWLTTLGSKIYILLLKVFPFKRYLSTTIMF